MSAHPHGIIQRGLGSKDRPVTRDLWARDSREPSVAMLAQGNVDADNPQVDFSRYFDPAYARLEVDKIWLKSWLFACREEDIPAVGDRVPFVVGTRSFFIVRSAIDEFKAFFNSCIHRGTKLCPAPLSAQSIRCPFHGWEWNNDGSLRRIPNHWDFKGVGPNNGRLREVRLGRWGGFIFINADEQCAPLEEALSVIPAHLKDFAPEKRYTAARFRKVVPANWKVAQEAFLESYHTYSTHPEAVPYNGESQSQYDIWDSPNGHIGRQITPSAVPSVNAPPEATSLEAAIVYAKIMIDWHYPTAQMPKLDPLQDLRKQLADWHRAVQLDVYRIKNDQPDAAMIDSTLYFMFPHFCVWLSESLPFSYQFTPHEADPEKSHFEVRLLLPVAEGKPSPASSPPIEVGIDQKISQRAPAFAFLGSVFDQDMANMPLIQEGMRSADPAQNHSQLGTYQESLVQHWNSVLDQKLAR
jgi:phenylpropionate dioxygenase-like ring-hydroxylating dioxygenase large terminal subunit